MYTVLTLSGVVYKLKKSEGGCKGCALLHSCTGLLRPVFDPGNKAFTEYDSTEAEDSLRIDDHIYRIVPDKIGACVHECSLSELCLEHDISLCELIGRPGHMFVED